MAISVAPAYYFVAPNVLVNIEGDLNLDQAMGDGGAVATTRTQRIRDRRSGTILSAGPRGWTLTWQWADWHLIRALRALYASHIGLPFYVLLRRDQDIQDPAVQAVTPVGTFELPPTRSWQGRLHSDVSMTVRECVRVP